MARRSQPSNPGLSPDLRDHNFAREFLLAALDQGLAVQPALGKVIHATGVRAFAATVGMAASSVRHAIAPRRSPSVATLNRLLAPFELQLAVASADHRRAPPGDITSTPSRRLVTRIAAGEAGASSKLSAHYTFWGTPTKVEHVLDGTTPPKRHHAWRKGDVRPSGATNKTSGVGVDIGDFADPRALVRAVDAFLRRNDQFLRHAAAHTGHRVWSELLIMQFVYPFVPTGVSLPPPTLRKLGELGVDLRCAGYPCEE